MHRAATLKMRVWSEKNELYLRNTIYKSKILELSIHDDYWVICMGRTDEHAAKTDR